MTDERSPHAGPDATVRAATPPATERRLTRPASGKMVAGVGAGLAAYLGVDPVLVRIGFVLLTVLTWIGGPLAYGILWIVMPVSDDPVGDAAPVQFDPARTRTWFGIGALVLGVALLVRQAWDVDGTVVAGVLAIGIGFALWSRTTSDNGDRITSGPSPTPPTDPPPLGRPITSGEVTSTLDESSDPPPPPVGPPAPPAPTGPPPVPAPRRRRERSFLGRLVIGTAAIFFGVVLILEASGAIALTVASALAWLLLIIGIGLVVGTWWGQARWLIGPGVVLTCLLITAHALPTGFVTGGFGDVTYHPRALTEVRPTYQLTAGELHVDLSDVRLRSQDVQVDVRLSFGELTVTVPDDVAVTAFGQAFGGEVILFGRSTAGFQVDSDVVTPGAEDEGRLHIDARVGFGELTVRRASSAPTTGPHRIQIDLFDERIGGSRTP